MIMTSYATQINMTIVYSNIVDKLPIEKTGEAPV